MLDDAVPVSLQAGPDLRGTCRENFTPYHNYHVSRRQAVSVPAEAFSKQAFQRISLHRFRDLFTRNCETEARVFALSGSDQNGYTVVAATNVVLKYLLKIARAGKSQPSRKRLAEIIGHVMA
ncbi:MAG: hypothetical protein PVI79_05570 [Gammaproteobacteria bacterium]